MNMHEVGQKVWDTHNNRVYTLKSSEEKYGTIMWHVEENDYEWRDDWFTDIPKYVQDLIVKVEATEKAYGELQQDVKRYFYLDEKLHVDRLTVLEAQEKCELAGELSKVCEEE